MCHANMSATREMRAFAYKDLPSDGLLRMNKSEEQ